MDCIKVVIIIDNTPESGEDVGDDISYFICKLKNSPNISPVSFYHLKNIDNWSELQNRLGQITRRFSTDNILTFFFGFGPVGNDFSDYFFLGEYFFSFDSLYNTLVKYRRGGVSTITIFSNIFDKKQPYKMLVEEQENLSTNLVHFGVNVVGNSNNTNSCLLTRTILAEKLFSYPQDIYDLQRTLQRRIHGKEFDGCNHRCTFKNFGAFDVIIPSLIPDDTGMKEGKEQVLRVKM